MNSSSNIDLEESEDSSDESSDSIYDLPGELGAAVFLPNTSDEINKFVNQGWKNYQFNEYVSSLISVQRSLKDFRSEYCLEELTNYSENLPEVSIIIVFYNEAWSTLIRSIFSIINRSPSHLIEEIILVDDGSEFEHLKDQLDDFIEQFEKVRKFSVALLMVNKISFRFV